MKTKIIKQQEQVVEEKQLQREELMLQLKSTRDDLRKRDDHIDTLKVRRYICQCLIISFAELVSSADHN